MKTYLFQKHVRNICFNQSNRQQPKAVRQQWHIRSVNMLETYIEDAADDTKIKA